MAFLYGWKCFLVMDPAISAALATGLATHVSVIVPLGPVAVRLIGIGAIVVLGLVHTAGVKPGTHLLTTMTVLKLALILALHRRRVREPVGRPGSLPAVCLATSRGSAAPTGAGRSLHRGILLVLADGVKSPRSPAK